ncbi:tryptophan synthase beta subunit-like PLP-dependent enzyme [Hesseltinella vesiculosa]|uniref:Tryptophan synthase beta subunit-like PLP-dependent enzyme n=1 Tax=Hesseltinella vesiculosa TaxID=101127 RepID=A0A1X2GLG5_9FUNG|nr:tryptophan synthase beta subunit-like PLP-dependent enzyme [Hesseltinella vesiculosa]
MVTHLFVVEILAKLEYTNPGGSIKDRMAVKVLQGRHQDHANPQRASRQKTLIIPTTGDLGLSVATLAARKRYRIICVLPERTSRDRVALLKALGVEILRTPNKVQPDAPESALSVARRLAEQLAPTTHVVVLDAAAIPNGVYDELAQEIIHQTQGNLDYLFVGVSSGITISQLSCSIKEKMPRLKIIAVEPSFSVLADQCPCTLSQDWRVEDIGNHLVPDSLDRQCMAGWVSVSDKAAYSTARRLIRDQGLMCGPSSGALMAAAIRYANEYPPENHSTHEYRAMVLLGDRADHFTSTLLNDDWLFENDLADDIMVQELQYASYDRYRGASVEDLQLPAAITVTPKTTIARAFDLMLERDFSQLPVIHADNKKLVGYVSLATLQNALDQAGLRPENTVDAVMFSFRKAKAAVYQVITPDTSLADLAKFFEHHSFAVVTDLGRKWCLGVATKYDLISFLHRRQGF